MRTVEIITHAMVIGAGATAVMDLWAACLRRFWRVPSLDYALLGRWIGHFPGWLFHARKYRQRRARPHVARLRSLVTHTVYGVGLYVSAWLWVLLNG